MCYDVPMTDCPHLTESRCAVAEKLSGVPAPTTDKACEACCNHIAPQQENFVTACLALSAIRTAKGKEARKALRASLSSLLVMSTDLSEEARELKRLPVVVPCEQNVAGICVVATHLAGKPVPVDARCEACSKTPDWRMPNTITAEMAIDVNPGVRESYECYTESTGGPGTHMKGILYAEGVRGLRRCELDTVTRMNGLGVHGCKERLKRVTRLLQMDAEASGFDWVFKRKDAQKIVIEAVRRAEHGSPRGQTSTSTCDSAAKPRST